MAAGKSADFGTRILSAGKLINCQNILDSIRRSLTCTEETKLDVVRFSDNSGRRIMANPRRLHITIQRCNLHLPPEVEPNGFEGRSAPASPDGSQCSFWSLSGHQSDRRVKACGMQQKAKQPGSFGGGRSLKGSVKFDAKLILSSSSGVHECA